MNPYIAEAIGTAILIIFGGGVVANVVLNETKGHESGWIVITWGWAIGVFMGVFTISQVSGGHINPAVTIGLAAAGLFDWAQVPIYIAAQTLGAFLGGVVVWLAYKDHFAATEDEDVKLAIFSTSPEIRNYRANMLTEVIGTFVLVFGVLYLNSAGFLDGASGEFLRTITIDGQEVGFGLGALSALPVALVVLGIGLSLGGPTGYAINPARDFGPRIAHAVLPFPHKGSSDWAYSWVPIVGPIIGALLAAGLYHAL
ncbi:MULTISPECIES: MIP/aquaporin family protein [Halomicrobium]|uniref:MIP family channel protein n=2 Tax=Halomicrobium mukohataei TaxID=57705 RepID=C7NYT2_HALMD|nr:MULTISPECIES: MIP/aquaporin family protein [Halomicrobium]ACV48621.1 MIP family channel protein [Halomicrobium mukohataei DSM 12286]QCD67019.1 aquaporin family protein [Halomicrobium mukohataei]QFR21829.1 MIP family channel protein [Halomicrobium sp. ZPS1]